ncbi:MAG: hypothetical protein ACOH1Y_06640 [Propionicimonas sp.]
MVEDDRLAAAELAYQRCLVALHEARAELAGSSAAQHRFSYDRVRLEPAAAATRAAELESVNARLRAHVEHLRDLAGAARAELRRLTDDPDSEPEELSEEPAEEGFQQPPFDHPPFGASP